jgi:hypothetical protein
LTGAVCRRVAPLDSRPSPWFCRIAPNDCRLGMMIPDMRRWLSASVVSEADFLIKRESYAVRNE